MGYAITLCCFVLLYIAFIPCMKYLKNTTAVNIIASISVYALYVIFDNAFFGLSLFGKHNIYNMVIVDNSYLSALLYFIGLIGVTLLGYGFNMLLSRKALQSEGRYGA